MRPQPPPPAAIVGLVLLTAGLPGPVLAQDGGGSGLPPASFMGTNLGFFASYAEWVLVDVFKMSAPWVSGVAWTPDGPPRQRGDGGPVDVDGQGWGGSLLPDQVA